MTNAVDIENVSLVFGGEGNNPVLAVDTIDIAIPKGQFVAIVGPSGCGKTTVLNMLAGLIPPTAGSVKRNGEEVDGPSRDVGYMLARSALSPWRTAIRNIEMGLQIHGVDKVTRRERAHELISLLHLDGFESSYPSQLAQTRLTVQGEFINLWERSGESSVIFVTHDLEEAVLLADRVIVMTARPGRIKSDTIIDLPRPRVIDELRFDDKFKEAEHRIWKELRDEII
jgi:NitT/TauT family transport system ATP-binding protein